MYPIKDTTLTLSKIAFYWSRYSLENEPESELFDVLLCAFWEGDFEGQITISDDETNFGREIALKALSDHKEQPGLLFLTKEEDETYPQIVESAFGSKIVDMRERVIVPSDGNWTPSLIDQAYAILAKTRFDDFDSQFSFPLKMIRLGKTSFQRWIKNNGGACDWWGLPVAEEPQCLDAADPDMDGITPTIANPKAPKPAIQAKYESWNKEYRKLAEANPSKSRTWCSLQIARLGIAQGNSSDTIRKNMGKLK